MAEGIGTLRLPDGCKCLSSIAQSFNYHAPIDIEGAQVSFSEEKITPQNGVSNEPYEFILEPIGDTFIATNTLHMYVKAKILKQNGTKCAASDIVAPVNNLLMSLWKNIEVKVNNVVLTPSSSYNIALKAMIQTLLSYESTNNNCLLPSMFVMDTDFKYDAIDDTNSGFKKRRTWTKESKSFDLCGPLAIDIAANDNFFAPGNRISLRFTRNSDDFLLMTKSNEKYKLVIEDLALFVRRIRVDPSILEKIVRPNLPQRYLSTYNELKEYPIAAGLRSFSTKLYTGRIPKHLVITQVKTKSLVGDYGRNPFNFGHFNISRINLKINGVRIPSDPLTPDFSNALIMREFLHLYLNTGKFRINRGNCLSDSTFRGGAALFPFDLTQDQCNGLHLHAGSEGTLELEMEWTEGLKEGLTILVHASSDQVMLLGGEEVLPQVSIF